MSTATHNQLIPGVQGPVFAPDDPAGAAELAGFNTAATHVRPTVVGATSAEDVALAVRYAAEHDRPVVVLATGHGGASSTDAVVITTRRLGRVQVDPVARLASVQAGVRWQAVLDAATPHGLAPLNGSSPGVGVVGYTLGGGMPMLGRTFGYAADHVRALEVVTADGRIRRVDAVHDPELFWALRGGKGSFGVVTSIEFDLMPVERIFGGSLVFPADAARDVLHAYATWSATLPDEATTSLAIMRLPDLPMIPEPLRGTCTVHVRIAFVGDARAGADLVAPLRAVAPPLLDSLREMPYREVASITNDPTEPMPGYDNGTLLRELGPATVDALLEVAGPQEQLPITMIELRQLGGAIARCPRHPNAAGGRSAAFAAGVIAPFPPPLREVVPAAAARVLAALQPWSTGEVPLNFLGEVRDPAQAGRAWSAESYRRLVDAKRIYDPQNLFRAGFAVQPVRP